MPSRRSTRSMSGIASKPKPTVTPNPKATKTAAKTAAKTTKKIAQPKEVSPVADKDEPTKLEPYVAELKTKSNGMTRKIKCTIPKGASAILDDNGRNYTQSIKLKSSKPFSLEPILLTDGQYAGRHVLLLEPEPSESDQFPFLNLPAEIRNMIYSLVLERHGSTIILRKKQSGVIDFYWRDAKGVYSGRSYSTALMRLNKQVNRESNPYLFSCHKFDFTDTTFMEDFLKYIGPARVKSLVSVSVSKQHSATMKKAYKLLAAATSLEKLEVMSYHWSCSYISDRRQNHSVLQHALVPLIQALCSAGKSREDAIGILYFPGKILVTCEEHGAFSFQDGKEHDCAMAKKTVTALYQKFHEEMCNILDDAEAKKKPLSTPIKTRAGRNTKVINYADENSEDDEY